MSEDQNKPSKKRIMAISNASYRGVALYEVETGPGVSFFLGTGFFGRCIHVFDDLEQATAYIDAWYDLKKN